jgi:hypothetical protein
LSGLLSSAKELFSLSFVARIKVNRLAIEDRRNEAQRAITIDGVSAEAEEAHA